MLSALIVDDEAPARSELRYLLEETGRVDSIEEASSAKEAVEALIDRIPNVMFLDIQMPNTNGMQLAKALHDLKNPPAVVFVTAYNKYAVKAFDVDAIDYLLKPVETDRLNAALDKVQAKVDSNKSAAQQIERLSVEKGGKKMLIPVDHIRYIEARDDYTCVYTAKDCYLSSTSLSSLETKLDKEGFFRVHRGYIVNLNYVEDVEFESSAVIKLSLKDIPDKKIVVSRRRVVPLKRALGI